MPKRFDIQAIPDETAERIAFILGDSCAYARALRELRRRRELGEDVHIFRSGATVLVGPHPSAFTPDAAESGPGTGSVA